MLAIDLTLDPSTAITAGTSAPLVFSLLSNTPGSSIRSVASVAQTAPKNVRIGHQTSTEKAFKTAANASVPAPDVVFDRRLFRLDTNVSQTSHLDPQFRINRSVLVQFVTPRLGSESPTVAQLMDDLLSIVSSLRASSNANAVRFFNGEV